MCAHTILENYDYICPIIINQILVELAVSIDIGGTNTKIALISQQGKIMNQTSMPSHGIANIEQYFQELFSRIDDMRASLNGQSLTEIAGIGIGAPGCNGKAGIIDYAANLPFDEPVEIVKICKAAYQRPTFLINDSNAAALGEKYYGGAKALSNFMLLTLGTGLGCGIFLENQIISGKFGLAGELGHVNVVPEGRACGCGRRGCLETYVSATGIKRTVFELMANERDASSLRSLSYDQITAKAIFEAARQEDPIALQAFAVTGKVLGEKLSDMVIALEPEAIFLSGGLTDAGNLLFEPTTFHLNKNLLDAFKGRVQLIPSTLGANDAALLGAASLVWEYQKVTLS